jgi:DNA-binding NtrC family response regulator
MCAQRRKILNVARNEALLKSRSSILEGADYEVVPALNILDVQHACETHGAFDLVIIGYALPKGEKRRVMLAVRQFCGRVPMLELYSHGTAAVDHEADEELASADEPDVLLAKVSEVLGKRRKKSTQHRSVSYPFFRPLLRSPFKGLTQILRLSGFSIRKKLRPS